MDTKNKLIKLNGIIIGESNYKEYDKLLTILTEERGKISVYAFGVRRPNSKNIGKAKLFTFGNFELREIGNKYQLENINFLHDFTDMLKEYENNCYASYFIELVNYFELENEDCKNVYELIYHTFTAMTKKLVDLKLIRRIFELKLLKYEGIYKESDNLYDNSDTLRYTWDYILKNKPSELYNFKLRDDIFKAFELNMVIEMRDKVNKKFKSQELINEIV